MFIFLTEPWRLYVGLIQLTELAPKAGLHSRWQELYSISPLEFISAAMHLQEWPTFWHGDMTWSCALERDRIKLLKKASQTSHDVLTFVLLVVEYFVCLFCFCLVSLDILSSLGCPRTHPADRTHLELTEIHYLCLLHAGIKSMCYLPCLAHGVWSYVRLHLYGGMWPVGWRLDMPTVWSARN